MGAAEIYRTIRSRQRREPREPPTPSDDGGMRPGGAGETARARLSATGSRRRPGSGIRVREGRPGRLEPAGVLRRPTPSESARYRTPLIEIALEQGLREQGPAPPVHLRCHRREDRTNMRRVDPAADRAPIRARRPRERVLEKEGRRRCASGSEATAVTEVSEPGRPARAA